MTIYLDIIFFENIIMNYIILLATALILKRKVNYIRIFFASTLGSVYVIVSYITNMQTLFGITMKILLSVAITYIAFNSKTIKNHIKDLLVFYLVSFIFGGTAFAMIYFIKPQNIIMKNGVYIGKYAFNSILLGGIIGFILVNIVFKLIKKKISKDDMNCKMEIYLNEKNAVVKAMVDTGNMLKDPITKIPVAIVEKNALKEIISEETLNNLQEILGGEDNTKEKDINTYNLNLRLIPFSSLGREHRLSYSI